MPVQIEDRGPDMPPIVVLTRDRFKGFSNIPVANSGPDGRFVDIMGNPVPTFRFDYFKGRYVEILDRHETGDVG